MSSLILTPDRLQPDLAEPSGPGRWILPSDPRSAALRLRAYTGGYPARIREALEESFPATARIIGPHQLTELAERYVRSVPLRSYNLNDAGMSLSEFLHTDLLAAELPFLPDLAELEWRVTRAFHARQVEPLDPEAVSRWTPDQWAGVVLRFQPWLAIVTSRWPIRRIWRAAQREGAEIQTCRSGRRSYVLVRRVGFAVRCESLAAGAAHALTALLEGRALGEVIERLNTRTRPENVSRWFTRWMAMGAIARGSGPRDTHEGLRLEKAGRASGRAASHPPAPQ